MLENMNLIIVVQGYVCSLFAIEIITDFLPWMIKNVKTELRRRKIEREFTRQFL